MNPVRTDGLGDFLWRAFATALIAVALHAADSSAFQNRGAPGLRGVFSALLSAPTPERETLAPPRIDGEVAFRMLDFDFGDMQADRCVAAGWFATLAPAFDYFTAVGVALPDAEVPVRARGEGEEEDLDPLAVGTWAGTGFGWRPASRLRLSLEARWNPADLSLGGEGTARDPFQAGLSLAFAW